jgi:CheY-like chemotaxis protein
VSLGLSARIYLYISVRPFDVRGMGVQWLGPKARVRHREQLLVKCRLKVQLWTRNNPATLGGRRFGEEHEFPEAKIIVLTTYQGDVQILRALKAGARGYLLKNTFHRELIDTIRTVHVGKKALSPEASYELAEHATDDALTPAEINVLRLISRKCQ